MSPFFSSQENVGGVAFDPSCNTKKGVIWSRGPMTWGVQRALARFTSGTSEKSWNSLNPSIPRVKAHPISQGDHGGHREWGAVGEGGGNLDKCRYCN